MRELIVFLLFLTSCSFELSSEKHPPKIRIIDLPRGCKVTSFSRDKLYVDYLCETMEKDYKPQDKTLTRINIGWNSDDYEKIILKESR